MLAVEAFISGTESADTIFVDHLNSETIVTLNGQTFRYADADLLSLTIHSRGGNDTITIARTGTAPLTVDAGSGSDLVHLGTGRFFQLNSNLITIHGGGDAGDTLEIHDERSDGDTRDYQISSEYFTKRNDPTVAVFEGFRNIVLLQNEESTTTEVGPVEAGVLLSVGSFGRDGQNSYVVGHEVLGGLDAVQGTLRIGGDDNDRVTLDDRGSMVEDAEYVLTVSNPSGPPGAGNFSVLDLEGTGKIELYGTGHADVLDVDLLTSAGDNTTRVRHTLPDVKWNIRDTGGADTIMVGDGNYAQNIRGEVVVIGQGGDDTLIVNDRFDLAGIVNIDAGSFPIPFSWEKHDYTFTADSFQKAETLWRLAVPNETETVTAPQLKFHNMAGAELWASWTTGNEFGSGEYGTTFTVNGVASGTSLKIIDEVGNSRSSVGDGRYLANIRGPVTIEGGTGRNVLTIDDRLFVRAPLGANTSYKLDSEFVGLTEYGTFAIGLQHITSPPSPEGFLPELRYTRVEEVTFEGSQADDRFNVLRTPADVAIVLRGHDGEDTFNVGGGRFLGRIRGPVTINGGSDDDRLVIDDRDSTLGGRYVLTGDGIAVNTASLIAPLLSYSLVQDVRIEGNAGDNLFQVDSTRAAVAYNLRGNGGTDEFRVDAARLNSNVTISGGSSSAAPGDSLHVTGTPTSSASYTPSLNPQNPSSGAVRVGGHDVSFSTLEAVFLENFESVMMVTPRSHDVINVTPDANGWTKISGTSGHPSLLLPFASISFRDVRDVTLDTRALDLVPFAFPPTGQVFNSFPHDRVSIAGSALEARGLESFSIVTGFGSNIVNDHTLEDSVTTPAVLNVDGLGGSTTVNVFGSAPQLEFEQLVGLSNSLAARDADGRQTYQIGTDSVTALVMKVPQRLVWAIAEDQELTIDAVDGVQRIQGTVTTLEVTPDPDGSRLVAVLLGDSTLNEGQIVFDEFEIQGTRPFAGAGSPQGAAPLSAGLQLETLATPDHITIRPLVSGLQSEPRPPVDITGYGPEDTISFVAPSEIDGTPEPTSFSLAFQALDLWDIKLLARPVSPFAELNYTVIANEQGAGPALGFVGNNHAGETATVSLPAEGLARVDSDQLIKLLVHGVPTIVTNGTDADEFFSLTTLEGGGLQSRLRQTGSDGFDKIELLVVTDPEAQTLTLNAGGGMDQAEVSYPEPDFRSLTIDSHGVEVIDVAPNPAAILIGLLQPVRQTLTPTSGEFHTSNLLLTHDDAVTTSRVESTFIELLVTADPDQRVYSRDLSLGYRYLGSEGKYEIKDVEFAGKFELNIEHKQEAANKDQIEFEKATFEQEAKVKITGDKDGEAEVTVTKQNVAGKVEVIYEGETTHLEKLLINADDEPLFAKVTNPGGTTQIEKIGNVVLAVPDLDGTGIDPTQPFSTFVVTNTLDAGPGSLRAAMEAANAYTGVGFAVITYNIPTTDPNFIDVDAHLPGGDTTPDVFVISPLTALPAITRGNVVINGQSQHSVTGDTNPLGPEIVLAGNLAGGDANGLHLASSDNVVHGLNIQQFGGDGVLITGKENTLTGNYIGTTATGDAAAGNGASGVYIDNAAGNLIGGTDAGQRNVISGNGNQGIWIVGAMSTHNVVVGNYIGTDADGTAAIPNIDGVFLWMAAAGNRIGGPSEAERNVISGNQRFGVHLNSTSSNPALINYVQGNYIGTDRTGLNALGNNSTGIRMLSDHNTVIAGNVVSGNRAAGIEMTGFASPTKNVRIEGNLIGVSADGQHRIANAFGILIGGGGGSSADNILVAGNVISGNNHDGVWVTGPAASDVRIQGNFIGTNLGGTTAVPNHGAGLLIQDASGVLVGGTSEEARNFISGNNGAGVSIVGAAATDNVVIGNYIGTDAGGTEKIPNSDGVIITGSATGNRIGGTTEDERNLISGNARFGVILSSQFTQPGLFNAVQGNYIGTDRSGMEPLGNTTAGIGMIDHNAVIGGAEQGAGNVISGNRGHGIWMFGSNATQDIRVQGNFIGTTADGHGRLSNDNYGILIHGQGGNRAHNVTIGGEVPGAGNVISGNGLSGIRVEGEEALNIQILGNFIGTDIDGAAAIGNGTGIELVDVNGVLIGGTSKHARNVIAHNALAGVAVLGDAATGNTIRGNSIHSNGALGIDLGGDGVTPNDNGEAKAKPPVPPDTDEGANELQNWPEIKSVTAVKGGLHIVGQLRSTPKSIFTIDFYASAAAHPSGYGEGQRWLGSIVVATDADGAANIKEDLLAFAEFDEFITATATSASGSTSEFSAAVVVRGPGGPGGGGPGGGSAISPLATYSGDSSNVAEALSSILAVEADPAAAPAGESAAGITTAGSDPDSESELLEVHPSQGTTTDAFNLDDFPFAPSEDEYDPDALFASLDGSLLDELLLDL